jgi:hypothetical protein
LKACIKRDYITVDENTFTVTSDGGAEFKTVFHDWLYEQNIFHRYGLAGRHSQHANIESLNKQLGRVFNGFLNGMEEDTGRIYREWTDVVDEVRIKLNT